MLWHIKLLRISSGLWICRSHSIWWKLDFCQLCNLTAGCNFNNQLLFTAFCSTSVGWIKTNGVIYIPIVFCPLTVYASGKLSDRLTAITSERLTLTYQRIFIIEKIPKLFSNIKNSKSMILTCYYQINTVQ